MNNMTELEKIAKIWQIQLNLELSNPNKNVRLSFKDIGAFAELLAINYLDGFVGSGSGGMGLDLVNYAKHKAVEVKSCCTIQNSACKSCRTKFNTLFLAKCPKCGSGEYSEASDSRFGIDAQEFLNQYSEGFFDAFYFCYVSLKQYDPSTTKIEINLEWFVVDFKDKKYREIQLDYFRNQARQGRKAHCNLLPYSFDFYKLVPTRISKVGISFKINDLNDKPAVTETKCEKEELYIPIEKMHNEKEREQFVKLETYDPQTKRAKATDFTLHIPYAKKTLGKERGDTRQKVYNALK